MTDRKRVAVIGAGCSGLAAIKCCLDEGLEPVCFERTDNLGGLWRFTEGVKDGQGCVMRSTVINTSKEMMCYSDFPIPKEYPNFMHNSMVYRYFKDYASSFDLEKHIQYHVEVKNVSPVEDFSTTGRWTVQVENVESGASSTETFDAVLVCSGHHASRHKPSVPGLKDFKGRVLHSHDYKEPSSFVGKRVVIVGIGNSGGDMAVELSRVGKVFLSTRRGTWILNRVGPYGVPIDIALTRRFTNSIRQVLPEAVFNAIVAKRLNSQLDHDLYSLRPAYAPFAQHPMVNDDLGNRIVCGSVVIKPDIERFTATGVEFVDGSSEDNIDVVVLATGYKFGFPFLDRKVVEVKENRLPFFKYMFAPDLHPNTLAIIGCIQPIGAIMPISELQCRLATRVFKGDVKLPSSSEMWEDIQAKEAAMAKRYVASQRHTIQVDFIPFMDELAELNGCKPDVFSLLRSDPRLGFQVLFGPCAPYQYRLSGPGQWSGARQATLTIMDRIRCPLSTRPLPPSSSRSQLLLWAVALVVLLLMVQYIFL